MSAFAKLRSILRLIGRNDYEEAETENLLRDHDAAMYRVEASTSQITKSQARLLETIRLAKPDEMRETMNVLLERNKWRA